jgi:hypothetical protein
MRRIRLAPLTLLTLVLTGLALGAAGWFSPKAPNRTAEIGTARAADLNSEAANRHRRGQPTHWRYVMLHR